jgi:hypothetical protein
MSLNPVSRHAPKLGARPLIIAGALLVACASIVWSPSVGAQARGRAHVADSILGIRLGATLEEAREKLKGLRKSGGEGEREGEGGGGRKEAWMLKKSDYNSVAYQADGAGRIQWVTGFVRRGKEIPFEKFGDLSRAAYKSDQEAVWNVERPGGNYRLIAKGTGGKASVVHLLALKPPPLP